jgi:hypothetical protein
MRRARSAGDGGVAEAAFVEQLELGSELLGESPLAAAHRDGHHDQS